MTARILRANARRALRDHVAEARRETVARREGPPHLPALGAQRRLEARIGQLLGEARRGDNQHSVTTESSEIDKDDRADFRVLARALDGEDAQ